MAAEVKQGQPSAEELLRAVPMFTPLPQTAIESLARHAEIVPFAPGEIICRQGDPGGSLYIVGTGQVEVIREDEGAETLLATLNPGEFFGELAMLDGEPRSATVRTLVDCTCIVLHRSQFFSILREPNVLENLLFVLAGRVRAADKVIGASSVDNRKLEEQALTDPLTSLGNRRKLLRDLQVLEGQTFALAMCDIDNFKKYNDQYGHGKGDEALRTVARTMAERCRAGDEVYRYGGEEFVVVMPATSAGLAAVGMERLRRAVERVGVPHEGNPPHNVLTFSSGVALVPAGTETSTAEALQRADEALYEAKRSGRNRIIAAKM
jgi:diguanylate cyclase (GGDEF)-like protein